MALRWSTTGLVLLTSNGRANATRKTYPFLGSRPFAFPPAPLCVQSLHLSTAVAALPLSVPMLDPRIFSTSINASFNLISLCGAAAGYLALFMAGWSPCLWTLGYQILNSTSGPVQAANKNLEFSLHELVKWWRKLLNPPLYGVLLGILVGATPLSYSCLPANHVFNAEGTRGFLISIRSLLASILQPIFEGANVLGSAALPLQTIVLASTLASSIGDENNKERLVGAAASLHEKYTANVTSLESKASWAITVIRLLVMPLISFSSLIAFRHHRWLPADPLGRLVLLVVAAMPTAQNLVVLVQLHPNTRPLAGVLANILVRQYLISVVSLTVWLPLFFSFLRLR